MTMKHKKTQYYVSVLLVAFICCMLCVSIVSAAEPLKLQNPFSKPTGSAPATGTSTGSVAAAPPQVSAPTAANSCQIVLQTDRTRVYYQGKIQFDVTVTRPGTNAPIQGVAVTLQNLLDPSDTRRAVTNSYGKAVAGAYARNVPPQSEEWIATAIVDGMECSSRPVSVAVLEYDTPVITAESQIYMNPFSGADIISPYLLADWFWPSTPAAFGYPGFLNPRNYDPATGTWDYNGWTYSVNPYPYVPSWAVDSSGTPYYSLFGPYSGFTFPLFR